MALVVELLFMTRWNWAGMEMEEMDDEIRTWGEGGGFKSGADWDFGIKHRFSRARKSE